MGGSKRLLDEMDANYQFGLEKCIEAGAIEECESHPGSYYGTGEGVEDALELGATPDDKEHIQTAYEDNSGIDYCPSCDKMERD